MWYLFFIYIYLFILLFTHPFPPRTLRSDQLLDEIAVIEVTYEKYSELVEKEVNWIYSWIRSGFKEKYLNYMI